MSAAPRVLVVDDHALNIELVAFTLEADGFEVWRAADAAQALRCLAREVPDLILMDIQLPGMDGLALTRQLRRDPSMQQVLIVAFTAYAMRGDAERMLAAGCDAYLSKPIEVGCLAQDLRCLLARGRSPG